jgi:hypothetical protein
MTDYRRLKAFREVVDLVEVEFAERGIPLKPGAAAEMVAERAESIANRLGITPRSALNYLTVEAIQDLARTVTRELKEHQAAEDARPPVRLNSTQAGQVIAAFTVSARLGIVNGDPDVAADLCEVVARVGVDLRRQDLPIVVPRLLLSNGLTWASLCAEKLSNSSWAVLPGTTELDDDQRVAAQLRDDLEAIRQLVQ